MNYKPFVTVLLWIVITACWITLVVLQDMEFRKIHTPNDAGLLVPTKDAVKPKGIKPVAPPPPRPSMPK